MFLSSTFSIYTIIIQYFLANLNYNERALRFEYQQLGIENFILELKSILIERRTQKRFTSMGPKSRQDLPKEILDVDIFRYQSIMQRYQELMAGYENHAAVDYNIGNDKQDRFISRKILAFMYEKDGSSSLDRRLIISQYIVIVGYIILYNYTYF